MNEDKPKQNKSGGLNDLPFEEQARIRLEAAEFVARDKAAENSFLREENEYLKALVKEQIRQTRPIPRSQPPKEQGIGNAEVAKLWIGEEPEARRWLFAGLIPEKCITILSGHSGLGKSFVALLLSTLLCLGKPFFGRGTHRAPVLWIDRELDHDEVKRRAFQIARGLGLERPPEGLYYLKPEHRIGSADTQQEISRLVHELEIGLCVLDSLTVGSSGWDLTGQRDTVSLMKMIEQWGTVLAIDHITKAGAAGNQSAASIFGSTFKRAIARSTLQLMKADGGGLTLRMDKANFGETLDPIHFAIDFEREDGQRSVRFRKLDEIAPEMLGAAKNMPAYEQTLYALKQLYANGTGPVTLSKLTSEREATEKTVRNHLTRLHKEGKVKMYGDNTYEPITEADDYKLSSTHSSFPTPKETGNRESMNRGRESDDWEVIE